jgi:hypothetical protein
MRTWRVDEVRSSVLVVLIQVIVTICQFVLTINNNNNNKLLLLSPNIIIDIITTTIDLIPQMFKLPPLVHL